MRVTVKAAAKINLMLDIVGRLENGYHNLWMVMQSVDLYDTVAVERTGAGGEIRLTCSDDRLPTDETNLAFKAARTFFEATKAANDGISITINKAIPFAAGLAGGSADAAATLLALDRLYGTRLKMRTLNKIGLTLGAGCSVLFTGGHDAGAAYRGVANTRAGAAGLFYRAGEARAGGFYRAGVSFMRYRAESARAG